MVASASVTTGTAAHQEARVPREKLAPTVTPANRVPLEPWACPAITHQCHWTRPANASRARSVPEVHPASREPQAHRDRKEDPANQAHQDATETPDQLVMLAKAVNRAETEHQDPKVTRAKMDLAVVEAHLVPKDPQAHLATLAHPATLAVQENWVNQVYPVLRAHQAETEKAVPGATPAVLANQAAQARTPSTAPAQGAPTDTLERLGYTE